jgi:hypothetical protein
MGVGGRGGRKGGRGSRRDSGWAGWLRGGQGFRMGIVAQLLEWLRQVVGIAPRQCADEGRCSQQAASQQHQGHNQGRHVADFGHTPIIPEFRQDTRRTARPTGLNCESVAYWGSSLVQSLYAGTEVEFVYQRVQFGVGERTAFASVCRQSRFHHVGAERATLVPGRGRDHLTHTPRSQ